MRNDTTLTDTQCSEAKEGYVASIHRVTVAGLITNILLSVLKFIAGLLGASQAIVADAVHSLTDCATDIAVLMGVKYWSAPADADHPYGHRRIEAIVTLFIGGVLLAGALGLAYHAVVTIRDPHLRPPELFASSAALISIIVKEILYRWTKKVGKNCKSPAVVANAWHHRSDAISSIPALAASAIAALFPQWAFIDHVGAMIVSLLIIKVSWDIVKPALEELSEKGLSKETQQKIITAVRETKHVRSVHALRSRKYGGYIYVDLHIQMDGSMSVKEAHDIAGEVKASLLSAGYGIIDAVIHIEPFEATTSEKKGD